MYSAEVAFARNDHGIEMTLSSAGAVLLRSASVESIVRELQIRNTRTLLIDGEFSTEIPTTLGTLAQAAQAALPEPLAALKLVAACSSMGDVAAFPYPERRARPRAELPGNVDAPFLLAQPG